MSDLKIRGLDDEVVDVLKRAAAQNGRSLEAELRIRIEATARAVSDEFPSAVDWIQAGFNEVHVLISGYQYIVEASGLQSFRVTLVRSLTGSVPEWNTEIEETEKIGELHIWARAINVAARLNGDTAAIAMRDCIRWLAKYAGVDDLSRTRQQAATFDRLSKNFQDIVERVSAILPDGRREVHLSGSVVWHTQHHDVYLNVTKPNRIALMVYPKGQPWSVTNGKASYFASNIKSVDAILEELARLSVV